MNLSSDQRNCNASHTNSSSHQRSSSFGCISYVIHKIFPLNPLSMKSVWASDNNNEKYYFSSTPVKPVVSVFITPIIREINQQASSYVSTKKRIKTRFYRFQLPGSDTDKRVRLHDHGWQTGEEVEYDPNACRNSGCVRLRLKYMTWMRANAVTAEYTCALMRDSQTRSSKYVSRCVCRPVHGSFLSKRVKTLAFATKRIYPRQNCVSWLHGCAGTNALRYNWERERVQRAVD